MEYAMYMEYTKDKLDEKKKNIERLILPEFSAYYKAQESCGAGTKLVTVEQSKE